MGNSEVFYRMPRSALDRPVAGGRTFAEAFAEDWNGDDRDAPRVDGPGGLLEQVGGRITWSSNLGGFDVEAFSVPRRVVERMRGVTHGYGPWPGHPEEPEVFRRNGEIVYVAHDELVAAQQAVAAHAARGYAGIETWDGMEEDLAAWIVPAAPDEIEIWAFESGNGRNIPFEKPARGPDPPPSSASGGFLPIAAITVVLLAAVGGAMWCALGT